MGCGEVLASNLLGWLPAKRPPAVFRPFHCRGALPLYLMKLAAQLYLAFIAGILAAAGLAYWYYVQHMDGDASE